MSVHIYLLSLALCLSGGFQQGFLASVLNQPYIYIERFVDDSIAARFGVRLSADSLNIVWSFLNTCFPMAVIVGQFFAAWLCRVAGRKRSALIACALYVPGTLASTASYWLGSFELLFFGRLLWAFSNGLNSVNATVWIVECAPPRLRGAVAALQEFSMAVGSLLCQGVGIPFSSPSLWHLTFLVNLPFLAVAAVLFVCLPDSPQSIIDREGDFVKARSALSKFHGVPHDCASLDGELCSSPLEKSAPDHGALHAAPPLPPAPLQSKGRGIAVIFNPYKKNDDRSVVIRWAAWLGVFVKVAYVLTGARCLRAYSTFVLYSLSHFSYDSALYSSFIMSLLRLPATLIPVFLVDRVGRRPLILTSLFVSVLALTAMFANLTFGPDVKAISLVSFAALLLTNASGLGSLSRFYAAELVPRSLLLSAVSILSAIEIATKIAVEFAFFPLANVVGAWSLLIFFFPTCFFLLFLWHHCPETSGRTVYEVLDELAERRNRKVSFVPASG